MKAKKGKFKAEAKSGIRLTAKGLGVKEGQRIASRFALRNTETNECVYVYGTDEAKAIQTGAWHFKVPPSKIKLENAGHLEWKIIDKGLPTERAVQLTVWTKEHDVGVLIDDLSGFSHLKKKKETNGTAAVESDPGRNEDAHPVAQADGGQDPSASGEQEAGGEAPQCSFGKSLGGGPKVKAPTPAGGG